MGPSTWYVIQEVRSEISPDPFSDLPTSLQLKLSCSIAWLILARRSLDHISTQATSRLSRDEENPDCVSSETMQAFVGGFAVRVIAAFLDIASPKSEDLPEFYLICVAYSILILSQYEQKPPGTSDDEILQLLKNVERRTTESKTSSTAVRFSVERALKRFATGKVQKQSNDAADYLIDSAHDGSSCAPSLRNEGINSGECLPDTATPLFVEGGFDLLADMGSFFGGGYLGLATSFHE